MGILSFNSHSRIDRWCDYIPIVSTVTNTADIIQKIFIKALEEKPASNGIQYYYAHLKDKSYLRCVVLLVPVLGNLLVVIYDVASHYIGLRFYHKDQLLAAASWGNVDALFALAKSTKDVSLLKLAVSKGHTDAIYQMALNNPSDHEASLLTKQAAILGHLDAIQRILILPGLKVEEFVRMVDPKKSCHFITNCTHLSEVKLVFLGDQHSNKQVHEMNSRFGYCLCEPEETIFVEADEKAKQEIIQATAAKMIDIQRLPKTVVYKGWDYQNGENSTHKLLSLQTPILVKIGQIFQRIIGICNHSPLPNDSLDKVVKDSMTLIQKEVHPGQQVKIKAVYLDLASFFQTKMIQIAASVKGPSFSDRQNNMVKVLKKKRGDHPNQHSSVLAGRGHIVKSKTTQIDPILNKYLQEDKQKYLIVYLTDEAIDSSPHPTTQKMTVDFFTSEKLSASSEVINGALFKYEEAGKALTKSGLIFQSVTL